MGTHHRPLAGRGHGERCVSSWGGNGDRLEWTYTGSGDANLFAGDLGLPTVHLGLHGANFHQADEWVDVPSIGATVGVLLRLALAVVTPAPPSGARPPSSERAAKPFTATPWTRRPNRYDGGSGRMPDNQ